MATECHPMKSRFLITALAGLCLAELMFIVGLVGGRAAYPVAVVESGERVTDQSGRTQTSGEKPVGKNPATAPAPVAATAPAASAGLLERNQALEAKLAEVTKELDARKSEISFSYGSVRDSGRFVGMTFRKMFETAAAREATEAHARMADNQINILSLGPFIQDAEVFESDPVAFAQFQAPLISEVLGLPPERGAEMEGVLADLKAQSLKVEEGSAEWMQLNDAAVARVTAMVPENRRQAMRAQIDFLREYGVLMIPAYSILRSPAPTVAGP